MPLLPSPQQIQSEIEECFGLVPPLFAPALAVPEVLANLWQQTLHGYLRNPLPALFKEQLLACCARYCRQPYSIVCHSCALRPLGVPARQVHALLEQSAPEDDQLARDRDCLAAEHAAHASWPRAGVSEASLLRCSIAVFLELPGADACRASVRLLLGEVQFAHWLALLGYARMEHLWIEAHPGLDVQGDPRVRPHLAALTAEEPALADFYRHYDQQVQAERRRSDSQLATERARLERRRAEEALALERFLFQKLMDHIPDSIYFKDQASRFSRINHLMAQRFGLKDPSEAVGRTDFDFFTAEHAEQAFADEQAMLRADRPIIAKEEKETWPDGRETWVSSTKMPLKDNDGGIVGSFGISRDITERKRAESAHHQLNEELVQRVMELRAALDQIKHLQGLLPICAWCKKIRGDQNYWQSVEEYVSAHTDARFSHSICPECLQQYFGEVAIAPTDEPNGSKPVAKR